jgi:hypothetical protein
MKVVSVLVSLIVLLAVPCLATRASSLTRIYTDRSEGFSLRYPSMWESFSPPNTPYPSGCDGFADQRGNTIDIRVSSNEDCWRLTRKETVALTKGWKAFVAEEIRALRAEFGRSKRNPTGRLHWYTYRSFVIRNYHATEFTIDASGYGVDTRGVRYAGAPYHIVGEWIVISRNLRTVYKIDGTADRDEGYAPQTESLEVIARSFRIL